MHNSPWTHVLYNILADDNDLFFILGFWSHLFYNSSSCLLHAFHSAICSPNTMHPTFLFWRRLMNKYERNILQWGVHYLTHNMKRKILFLSSHLYILFLSAQTHFLVSWFLSLSVSLTLLFIYWNIWIWWWIPFLHQPYVSHSICYA